MIFKLFVLNKFKNNEVDQRGLVGHSAKSLLKVGSNSTKNPLEDGLNQVKTKSGVRSPFELSRDRMLC
jgi:hypothetical protein